MRAAILALFAVVLLLGAGAASAQDGDTVSVDTAEAQLGARFTITLEVITEPGATVDIDPLAPSWNGVEVIAIQASEVVSEGAQDRHRIELAAAAFFPGEFEVAPAIMVTVDGSVTRRELPGFALSIPSSLPADAPLELIGGPAPQSISGGQSAFLVPAIVSGVALGVLFLAIGFAYLTRRFLRRRRRRAGTAEPPPLALPPLPGDDDILRDPVPAYRSMAASIRAAIADHYGIPARALTTAELARRMEDNGIDRWQARLVSGLLQNCDAVIYAGYRPAPDRRRADITMAEEILGGLS